MSYGVISYPCPTCGHDGPHPVIDEYDDGSQVFECVGCYVEVGVPFDDGEEQP